MELLLLLLLIVSNVFGIGMIVPQIIRLQRTSSAEGVSAAWVGVSFALNFGWFSYGIHGGLWGLVPVSLGGMFVYLVVAIQLRSLIGSPILRPLAVSTAGTSAVLVATLTTAGWPALGLTLGFAYGPQFVPAALNVVRSETVAGVSAATWTMAATEAAIWVFYGLAVADHALIIGGAGGTVMAFVILTQLWAREESQSQPSIPSTITV